MHLLGVEIDHAIQQWLGYSHLNTTIGKFLFSEKVLKVTFKIYIDEMFGASVRLNNLEFGGFLHQNG